MAKISTNCFICNLVLEAPAEPKFISGGPRRRRANFFIFLQRVLELPDLRSKRSRFVHQISFCEPCLDELEVIKNELDEFDNLKKVVEGHMKEIQFKFRTSNGEESQAKSGKDVELDDETQFRSQMVTGLPSRSTAMAPMEDSSKTHEVFKGVTISRTLNHLAGLGHQATPSTSQRILYLPDFQIISLPEDSEGILDVDSFELNGKDAEDGVLNFAKELISSDDVGSEQRPSTPLPVPVVPTTKARRSGVVQKKELSNDPSNSNHHIRQGKKKLPTSPSTSPNTSRTVPKRNSKLNEKKHKCQLCPAGFNYQCQLTQHLRIHTGVKPFSCTICPKTFSKMSHLKEHQLVHSGEKEFRCKFCSKAFARPNDLKAHERVHTGEKPFLCKICFKTFSRCDTLVSHMRTHTREKPYPCKMCSKAFAKSSNLVSHMRTHTREKPYPCKMCTKTFSRCDTLVRHMSTHTREKPYKCTVCSREFAHLSALKDHKKTQHLLVG